MNRLIWIAILVSFLILSVCSLIFRHSFEPMMAHDSSTTRECCDFAQAEHHESSTVSFLNLSPSLPYLIAWTLMVVTMSLVRSFTRYASPPALHFMRRFYSGILQLE